MQDGHHSRHLENQFSTSLLKPYIALSRNLLFSNRMTSGSKQAKIVSIENQDGRNGSAPLNKMAARAKKYKIFKQHHVFGQWPDFRIFAQKYSTNGTQPKLLKWLCLAEQNGGQS